MKLKVLNSGSDGNCYILTSDSNKHLILDCGVSIKTIKKGLEFDIENTVAALCTHTHNDHSKAIPNLQKMGIPVWQPYLSDHKRQRTHFGEFECESFELPHNGCPNVGYLIRVGGQVIAYMTDMEYCGWDLSKQNINVMLIELNYQSDRIADMDEHRRHTILGHAEAITTLELVKHNSKRLHTVLFCHMSKSGSLDRDKVAQMIPDYIPAWCRWGWCKDGETYNIDSIPF